MASLVNVFESLGVSASLWDGRRWRVLHAEPSVLGFEIEHGAEAQRFRHNDRGVKRVLRERRTVLGENAGFSDLFVPIVVSDRIRAILVTGPFAKARPDATSILERWRGLSGRQGDTSDPEFLHYVTVSLSTLVLEPDLLRKYIRFLEGFARFAEGDDPRGTLLSRMDALRKDLGRARFVERMWHMAHAFVDTRTTGRWSSSYQSADLASVGLARPVDDVVVGLIVTHGTSLDPVEEIVRRDAFQRACVRSAQRLRGAASGRIGDHGVTFLSGLGPHKQRGRRALLDFARDCGKLAERYGLALHLGTSTLPAREPLAHRYASALQAAELALLKGTPLVEGASTPRVTPLTDMRRGLGAHIEENPESLPARFERYLDAVARHAGYGVEVARAHLEAGFERLAEPFLVSGRLEAKSLGDLYEGLEQAARNARTVADLCAAYRRAALDVSAAIAMPSSAHRDRSVRRAVEHVRRHFTQPLTLVSVARVAGFAPTHFSTLFKLHEGTTFSRYICQLRLDRARELLGRTELDLGRIAVLSGFRSREYFARVFRRVVGVTPMESRRRARVPKPRTGLKKSQSDTEERAMTRRAPGS
jgi:AraC-like DNA-binding protein